MTRKRQKTKFDFFIEKYKYLIFGLVGVLVPFIFWLVERDYMSQNKVEIDQINEDVLESNLNGYVGIKGHCLAENYLFESNGRTEQKALIPIVKCFVEDQESIVLLKITDKSGDEFDEYVLELIQNGIHGKLKKESLEDDERSILKAGGYDFNSEVYVIIDGETPEKTQNTFFMVLTIAPSLMLVVSLIVWYDEKRKKKRQKSIDEMNRPQS